MSMHMIPDQCATVDRYSTRVVTIHSEDRDITKYPDPSMFEIELPSTLKNILSIELFDIDLPIFYYNVSNYLNNSKFWVSIPLYFSEPIEVVIPDARYNYTLLAQELTTQINDATTKELFRKGIYVDPTTKYTDFTVTCKSNQRRFSIENSQNEFIMYFSKKSAYNDECTLQTYSEQISKNLGLPLTIGFTKETYKSAYDTENNKYILVAPKTSDLDANKTVYMEIDKFDWFDEAVPYSKNTLSLFNNDYNGTVNSCFAKLTLSETRRYIPTNKFIRVLTQVEERISRLRFKFRYHNGMLVDFLNQEFNFSLKFECRYDCK